MKLYTLEDSMPSIEQVGGKGMSLMHAASKGFDVPAAATLGIDFFSSWIEDIKNTPAWQAFITTGDIGASADALKKSCQELSFSDSQQQILMDLRQFLEKETISLMAVRSSSPEEDLEGASFAGIYETLLAVTDTSLEDAIRICFASALDERVIAYKQHHGYDPHDPRIAVIVQKQLEPDASGVAFSLNPVSNCYDECVINANFGLGETVVDGTVSSDQFVVDKVEHRILERLAGNKTVSHHVKADGGTETRTPASPSALSLDDEQVLEISSLTSRIESEYGKPMDIEWAYEADQLYLLQARPVTGYFKLIPELVSKPGEQKRLYQDGLLTEQGLVGSLSPLGQGIFEIMAKAMLTSLGGDADLPERMGMRIVRGRAYADVGEASKLTGKKTLVKTFEVVDSLGAEILTDLDLKPYKKGRLPPAKLLWKLLKMGVRGIPTYWTMYRRIRKAGKKPKTYLEFFLEENTGYVPELEEQYLKHESFGNFSWIAIELWAKYFYKISSPTLIGSESSRGKIQKMFEDEPQSVREQAAYLEQALPGNVTIEMGLLLYDLSQFPEVQQTDTPEEFLQKLEQNQVSLAFMESWTQFMQIHGHRCPRELDIATPRYREQPGEVFKILKNMSSFSDPDQTPRGVFEGGVARREQALGLLEDILEKQGKKLKIFRKHYLALETFAGYREIHKYYLIHSIDYTRRKALVLAEQWVKADRLDTMEQIFDLRLEEVVQAEQDSSLDLRSLVASNIASYEPYKNQPNPPVLIDSRGYIPSLPRKIAKENEFSGTPASPGIITGPVKILSRPDEKPILPGDILVTRATDPGWTPLFLNAAGVLLETGGTLQHGASVARESCKPCIVGLNDISKFLEDGQIVEMNGSTGLVTIL